jgi:putative transposase
MRKYIRNYVPGGTFFFTIVTYERQRFLTDQLARHHLGSAFRAIKRRWPFDVVAIVLIPDHLHTIWALPEGNSDYSLRIQKIKEAFTRSYLDSGGQEQVPTTSLAEHGQRGVWQPRFWEHSVRNEQDLKHCVDYVHWNPVKHGLVTRVADYPWSSFQRYVRLGEYAGDWGDKDPCPDFEMPE